MLRSLRRHSRCLAPLSKLLAAPACAPAPWRAESQDWAKLQRQAELVAAWPAAVLEAPERLALAEALAEQGAKALGTAPDSCGQLVCDFYESLEAPWRPVAVGAPAPALVACSGDSVALALQQAVCLLLAGHAVGLAATGAALEALRAAALGLPEELLTVLPLGPLATLPQLRVLRTVGPAPQQLWEDRAPPGDFGGHAAVPHGMARAPDALALCSYEVERSCSWEELIVRFGAEERVVLGLAALSKIEPHELYGFLDLLSALRSCESLKASWKHVVLTFCGSVLPADLLWIALAGVLSPFHERITLHAVGLGARGLARDPLKSFLKLVQSDDGLTWEVQEHRDWAAFLDWLPAQQNVNLFSLLRNLEPEVKRRCALTGGAAWVHLGRATAERARRWTAVA